MEYRTIDDVTLLIFYLLLLTENSEERKSSSTRPEEGKEQPQKQRNLSNKQMAQMAQKCTWKDRNIYKSVDTHHKGKRQRRRQLLKKDEFEGVSCSLCSIVAIFWRTRGNVTSCGIKASSLMNIISKSFFFVLCIVFYCDKETADKIYLFVENEDFSILEH